MKNKKMSKAMKRWIAQKVIGLSLIIAMIIMELLVKGFFVIGAFYIVLGLAMVFSRKDLLK